MSYVLQCASPVIQNNSSSMTKTTSEFDEKVNKLSSELEGFKELILNELNNCKLQYIFIL